LQPGGTGRPVDKFTVGRSPTGTGGARAAAKHVRINGIAPGREFHRPGGRQLESVGGFAFLPAYLLLFLPCSQRIAASTSTWDPPAARALSAPSDWIACSRTARLRRRLGLAFLLTGMTRENRDAERKRATRLSSVAAAAKTSALPSGHSCRAVIVAFPPKRDSDTFSARAGPRFAALAAPPAQQEHVQDPQRDQVTDDHAFGCIYGRQKKYSSDQRPAVDRPAGRLPSQ
jgi:hypothetical protein